MYVVIACYLLILAGLVYSNLKYHKVAKQYQWKKHRLSVLLPLAYAISEFTAKPASATELKQKEALQSINVASDTSKDYILFKANKYARVIALLLILNTMCLLWLLFYTPESKLLEGQFIRRPGVGEDNADIELRAYISEANDSLQQDFTLTIEAKKYTEEEFLSKVEASKNQLMAIVLNENVSAEEVRHSLQLIDNLPGTPFAIRWILPDNELVLKDGSINYLQLKNSGKVALLEAEITYETYRVIVPFNFYLCPYTATEDENLLNKLGQAISDNANLENNQDYIKLPEKVDSKSVVYEEAEESKGFALVLIGFVAIVFSAHSMEQKLYKKQKLRNRQILLDYPEVVNKLTMLIGAGMTIRRAFYKITAEYQQKRSKNQIGYRYVYEEMIVTCKELDNGVNESRAYDSFGRRLKIQEYIKLGAILSQNVTKGVQGLLDILQMEAIQAFEGRKELAKQLGEEASTKVLAPMMFMFLIVLIIIIMPAIAAM